jgi:hypothetical protein
MRARGQGFLALVVAGIVILAGLAFDRLGPKTAGAAPPGAAPSGAWFCPHGGGKGWRTVVSLANPGASEVTVRITTLGARSPKQPSVVTVPPDTEVRQDVPANDRASSTFVEYFGGWIAAGWTSVAGGADVGVDAEPCASRASRLWYTADNTTQLDQDAYLVIMNPFASSAVFDVALFTTDRAPIRASDLTDVSLRAHRSVSLRLNRFVADEEAVTAEVRVTSGRTAVASLGVTNGRGVRSALGWPGTSSQAFLPAAEGSGGQYQMAITVPDDIGVRFGATLFSGQPVGPVPDLVGASQDPQAARIYPLNTNGASAAYVQTDAGGQIVAALRSIGVGGDTASTGGATVTAERWVVTPSVAGSHSAPGLVLVNPGTDSVAVTLHLLGPDGSSPAADVTLTLPPSSAVEAPPGFLASAAGASVLVTSQGGGVVAMGASTSKVPKSPASYALAMGVPVPPPAT